MKLCTAIAVTTQFCIILYDMIRYLVFKEHLLRKQKELTLSLRLPQN